MDFSVISEDDNEGDVRLAPDSADDAPRNTNSMQSTVASVSSRPVGRVVGIIKRNWNS
jgi:exosome complex exonuclease DIS3/RRP44